MHFLLKITYKPISRILVSPPTDSLAAGLHSQSLEHYCFPDSDDADPLWVWSKPFLSARLAMLI